MNDCAFTKLSAAFIRQDSVEHHLPDGMKDLTAGKRQLFEHFGANKELNGADVHHHKQLYVDIVPENLLFDAFP